MAARKRKPCAHKNDLGGRGKFGIVQRIEFDEVDVTARITNSEPRCDSFGLGIDDYPWSIGARSASRVWALRKGGNAHCTHSVTALEPTAVRNLPERVGIGSGAFAAAAGAAEGMLKEVVRMKAVEACVKPLDKPPFLDLMQGPFKRSARRAFEVSRLFLASGVQRF